MKPYVAFMVNNSQLLSFGFLLTLFSAFGQTFLISLYVPHIAENFALSNTEISSSYATATLISAFTLPFVGRYVDIWPLIRFTIFVVIGFAMALMILSYAPNIIMVMVGFWGMRLTGQALMGHTAVSTMARAYDLDRGKAISLANIGHPAGEVIFPILIAFLITSLGWRIPLRLSALSLIIIVLPLVFVFLRGVNNQILRPDSDPLNDSSAQKVVQKPWKIVWNKRFWFLLPGVVFLGAINTAIFFFQIKFGESRGWSVNWVAGSIGAFAVASALGMVISGPLVDRFTAKQLFPFFILPYLVGLVLLSFIQSPFIYPFSLIFMGFSNGLGSTIINAVYAELFGTQAIGSIRSLFAMVGLFATALGPISFGLLLDNQFGFSAILLMSAGLSILIIGWSLLVLKLES